MNSRIIQRPLSRPARAAHNVRGGHSGLMMLMWTLVLTTVLTPGLSQAAVEVGDRPRWSFETTEGQSVDQNTHTGSLVVVDFWATWCGPCVASMPHMLEMYEGYTDRGVQFYAVSLDEDREAFDQFVAERQLPWKQHFAGGWGGMAEDFGVAGIPQIFVFGPDAEVVWAGHPMRLTDTVMDELLETYGDDGRTPQERFQEALALAQDALTRGDAGMFIDALPALNRGLSGVSVQGAAMDDQGAARAAARAQVRSLMAEVSARLERDLFAATVRAKPRAGRALVSLRNTLRMPEIGEPVSFSWTDLDGASIDAASLQGQVVIVDFWATWCGPCMAAMPHMTQLYKDHDAGEADASVRVLGVSLDDSSDPIRDLIQTNPDIAWPMVLDEGGAISKAWAVEGIPTVFIVGADGRLVWRGHPMDGMDEALARALGNAESF